MKILLVEDSPADADIFCEHLQYGGGDEFQVLWADKLADALRRLDQESFDVVLLDLNLPDSNGIKTLEKLRSLYPAMPVLILTGLDDAHIGIESVKNGAQDYLVKGQPSRDSIIRSLHYAVERKRLEMLNSESARKASESEAALQLALRAANTGFWSWDIVRNKHETNAEIGRIFDETDCTSFENFMQRIYLPDLGLVQATIKQCLEGKEDFELQFRVQWRDKSIHWVRAMGMTVFDQAGRAEKLTGILNDVTKQLNQQAEDKKLAILQQQSEFTAVLAHDLKGPILGSQRLLQLMRDGKFGPYSERFGEAFDQLFGCNQSLLILIHNVLDRYRLSSEENFLCVQRVEMTKILEAAIKETEILVRNSKLNLIVDDRSSGAIYGDALAMTRVLCNLIGNATRYTPPGGTIELCAYNDGDKGILEVTDSGSGIPPEQQEQIFERYYRGHNNTRADGLGLGLYLCRQLLERQSGAIYCLNTGERGAAFRIEMPLAQSQVA
ncbi:MAG: response regulator [Cyanobacteria bacterium SZAS TMP-1]|nr:response regulator [Cyanobacteria bacterium SZAS TMP-1]